MNGRKWTALSTLFSGAAAAALLAGTLTGGGQRVYASEVATLKDAVASAGVQVQNLETSAASSITMDLIPQSGAAKIPLSRGPVAAEGSANFYLPTEPTVSSGAYGVVLTSDRQIAAIARHEWLNGGRAGAATYGTVAPAEVVILPLVLGPTAAAVNGFADQVSEFSIQNAAETGSVTAKVELFATGNSTAIKTLNYPIAAGTSKTVKMGEGDFTGLPDTQTTPKGFVGYARITGTAANPLVVQSFVDFVPSTKAVYAFSGVPSSAAAATLYAPLLRRDFFGTTGVSIVNPGATAATVTVSYFDDPASPSKLPGGTGTEQISIPAASSVVLYNGPRTGNPLPDSGPIANNNGWFGSAKFESTQPILAVVNDAVINNSFATQTSGAYNVSSAADGAAKIFAPLVRRRHVASQLLTTGIQVQNVGSAAADITVKYTKNDGTAAGTETITGVQPGRSVNFYQDAANTPFPSGNFGSAVITSGQPLVLIVNDFSINATLDAALYNGLK